MVVELDNILNEINKFELYGGNFYDFVTNMPKHAFYIKGENKNAKPTK